MRKSVALFGLMALMAIALPTVDMPAAADEAVMVENIEADVNTAADENIATDVNTAPDENIAKEIITADGILSIEVPGDDWKELENPEEAGQTENSGQTGNLKCWFAVSDGRNMITIDHLSNGEIVPQVEIAGDENAAVCEFFISTRNEVFVVRGVAASQEELDEVMKAVGSVKVLKYDTKTAVVPEAGQTSAVANGEGSSSLNGAGTASVKENGQAGQNGGGLAQGGEPGIRQINAEYYVTASELNVRSGCSTDDAAIGTVYYGDCVTVNGAVTSGGVDSGWYEILYNGTTGYVSSSYLSATKPEDKNGGQSAQGSDEQGAGSQGQTAQGQSTQGQSAQESSSQAQSGSEITEQCQYCGKWFVVNDEYREHLLGHAMENMDDDNSTD